MARARRYWLFKSEPSAFSIDDLDARPGQTAPWDGVRNYQARNFLRDDVKPGDLVLFYYSREEPIGVAGTMEIVAGGEPDATQFNPGSPYYDPKSSAEAPRWVQVTVKLKSKFSRVITRPDLAASPVCSGMLVLKRGMRLSIQPVTAEEFRAVEKLAADSAS